MHHTALNRARSYDGNLYYEIIKFIGAQTELSFVPLYEGMPGHLEALKEFESRGFSVVDFVPVTRVAGGLLMMEMDSILARSVEPE